MKNIAWDIEVAMSKTYLTHLGLYLNCNDTNVSYKHKVYSAFEMISSVNKSYNVLHGGTIDIFSEKKSIWGYSDFVKLTTLYDEKKGLITNGTVTIKFDAHFVEES